MVLLTAFNACVSLELSWNALLRCHGELLDRLIHEKLVLKVNVCAGVHLKKALAKFFCRPLDRRRAQAIISME